MSSTVKLESVRFVKRVSNGSNLSKYGYIGMMQQNAEALKDAPWAAASSAQSEVTLTANKLAKTDGVWDATAGGWATKPTYTAYTDNQYDAFNQAGDARTENATMCGYAGCVAYRFKLPNSEAANALNSISLSLQRDRYLRAGVRIGLALSDSDTPSDDWSVVRGEATGCVRSESTTPAEGTVGVSSFGFLGQPDVPYLTASVAASGVITFDTSTAFAAAASYQYLYLYITLEDQAGYWNLYKKTTKRQYYIEGSAMLVADNCSFTFANAPASATPIEIVIGYASTSRLSGFYTGSVPQDLDEHPYSATDLTFLSTCGAPAAVTHGSETTFDIGNYSTDSTITSLGPGDHEEVATKNIYAQFLRDNFTRCTFSGPSSLHITPAASFNVAVNDNVIFMIRKKVLIPFTIPEGFRPSRVRVGWREYGYTTAYNDLQTVNLRHSIWITNGYVSNAYGDATLKRHEIYTAEKDTVGAFKLIGSFFHHIQKADDGDPDFTETFDIYKILDRGPYTILLTVYFDQGQISYTDGNMNNIVFGGLNMSIRETGIMTYKGALEYGWSPTITLIA